MNPENISLATQNILRDIGGTDGPLIKIILACCVLSGIVMCAKSLMYLGERDASFKGALIAFIMGLCLASFPAFLGLINATIFNNLSEMSLIADGETSGNSSISGVAQSIINFCIFFVQIIGVLAAIKGLKMHGEIAMSRQRQPDVANAANTHIIFGIACYNILWVFKIVCATAGGDFLVWYNTLFGHIPWKP